MTPYSSRRQFLRQILMAGAATVTGVDSLLAQDTILPASPAKPFRFAFVTDLHLMWDGDLRSAEGIAACLTAVEKLNPRPEFILVGGDLVHRTRDFALADGGKMFDFFLKIWNDHTSLPAHWTFGNHDLAGTSNKTVSPADNLYAEGLFKNRLHLPKLFYSYDYLGWHFVVLNDIALQPDRSYIGELNDEELQFLRTDLDAHRTTPTIICTHIPVASTAAYALLLAHELADRRKTSAKSMVCTNGAIVLEDLPRHNVRAILSGHLHHLEQIAVNGIPIINSGAVCGSYWAGPSFGTPEGFGVVDLGADGSVAFDYRDYGWKA